MKCLLPGNCFRCVSIHQKHENVLQYKESRCLMEYHSRNFHELCWTISVDQPLQTMFRVNGKCFRFNQIETFNSLSQVMEYLVLYLEHSHSPTAEDMVSATIHSHLSISVQVSLKQQIVNYRTPHKSSQHSVQFWKILEDNRLPSALFDWNSFKQWMSIFSVCWKSIFKKSNLVKWQKYLEVVYLTCGW